MSDLAYFEYATVIRPQENQLEGTPAHYLVEVAKSDPVTGEERDEEELKKLANDFLALALGLDVQEITGMIKCHDDHDQAAGDVYGGEPFHPGH